MKLKLSLYFTGIVLLAILTVGVGCTKAPNDAQLTSDIQTKLAADSGLQGKQLGVKSESGTVTLTGSVDNDAEREAAARYAASEPGVKQVINNLQVAAPAPVETAQATPPAPRTKPVPAPAPDQSLAGPPARVRSLPSSSSECILARSGSFDGTSACRSACGSIHSSTTATAKESDDPLRHDAGSAPGGYHRF